MSDDRHRSGRRGLILALIAAAILAVVVSGYDLATRPGSASTLSASPHPGNVVATGTFSGKRTQSVDLGTHTVGGSVWVSWVLRGPYDARAIFSLRLRAPDGGVNSITMGPESYGGVQSVTSDHGLMIEDVDPGTYRVTMVEIIRPQWDAGYAGKFTVFASQAAQ